MRLPNTSIPRAVSHVTALWLAIVLLGVSSVFALIRVTDNEASVHTILCASKENNERNLKTAIQFLKDHPNGTEDFSKSFILNSIQQDKQRVQALSSLSCG